MQYRAGNSISGEAIMGPYSPGGFMIRRNFGDQRDGGFIFNGY